MTALNIYTFNGGATFSRSCGDILVDVLSLLRSDIDSRNVAGDVHALDVFDEFMHKRLVT